MGNLVDDSELERQLDDAVEAVAKLQDQLDTARKRVAALSMIRDSARLLEDENFVTNAGSLFNRRFEAGAAAIQRLLPEVGSKRLEEVVTELGGEPGRRKTPSTRRVADLIVGSRREWTREDIYERYSAVYGFPDSWKNPPTAISNAITRAVENDWIVLLSNGRYCDPAEADPFVTPDGAFYRSSGGSDQGLD